MPRSTSAPDRTSAPSTRKAQARAAREARLAAEREQARKRERLRRAGLLAAIVAVAFGGVSLAVLLGGSSPDAAPAPATAVARYAGIPQDGLSLGRPDAPVVLEEFADAQCPFCRDYATRVLPAIVEDYVRPGRVRLVYRDLAFLGEDSTEAATFAAAAAGQDRLWDVIARLFEVQGPENGGWVTDDVLRETGAGIRGLDVGRAMAERDSGAVAQQLAEARARASRFGIAATPSFLLRGRDGKESVVRPETLEPAAFRKVLDRALADR